MLKKVGIYRTTFPWFSETFIVEQASHLSEYQPTFLVRSKTKETSFDSLSISSQDAFRIKQILFTLTRSPLLFGQSNQLKDLNLVHAHFGVDAIYAMPLARKLDIPLVATFHGYEVTSSWNALWLPWRPKNRMKYQFLQYLLYENSLRTKAAGFIAVSRFVRQKLLERGYPEEKIFLHYIGVDTKKFCPAANPLKNRYILNVARHTEKKGIDTLLKGFAKIEKKHPDVSLIQVGSGPMELTLKDLARELDLEHRITFLGNQTHAEVVQLMRNAEVFALSSQTTEAGDREGLPVVLTEASACGLPILGTWHSGIPEIVVDGETGLLVDEKDDQALAEKLDRLLSDRLLARKMGERGRKHACENFDIRTQSKKLEKIYDWAVDQNRFK